MVEHPRLPSLINLGSTAYSPYSVVWKIDLNKFIYFGCTILYSILDYVVLEYALVVAATVLVPKYQRFQSP